MTPAADHEPDRRGDATPAAVSPDAGDGWQDIATAPKDGTDILVFDGRDVMSAYWSDNIWAKVANPDKEAGGAWVQEISRSDTHPIFATHWQPLPAPPESGK